MGAIAGLCLLRVACKKIMNSYKARAPAKDARKSTRSKAAYRPKSKEKSRPEKEKAPARKKSNTDVELERGIDVT